MCAPMEKDSQDNKIHIALPIVLSIFLGGALLLSGLFLFLGVMASDYGVTENEAIAIMIMLTPVSVLAGLAGVWVSWRAGKQILVAAAFFVPIIWWGLIMLISWLIAN